MESSEHDLLLPQVEEENICLPLSVNAVSKYWNVDLPMIEAVEIAKKYPNVNGSILIEGIELAERHGLACKILHSSLNELKKFIDVGIPVIVILPGIHKTVQHASVISGYDENKKVIKIPPLALTLFLVGTILFPCLESVEKKLKIYYIRPTYQSRGNRWCMMDEPGNRSRVRSRSGICIC